MPQVFCVIFQNVDFRHGFNFAAMQKNQSKTGGLGLKKNGLKKAIIVFRSLSSFSDGSSFCRVFCN